MWFENICTIYCQVKKAMWILFVKDLGKKGTNIYICISCICLKSFMKETATIGGIDGKKRIRLQEGDLLTYIYFVFFGFWAMRVYNFIQKTELKFSKFS